MADVNHVLKKVFEEELSVIWDTIRPSDRFKEILGLDNIDLGINFSIYVLQVWSFICHRI